MKRRFVLFAAILSLLCPVECVVASGNHMFVLEQKWKRAQAWQKSQDKRWKALERDADRMLMDTDTKRGGFRVMPSGNH